jgi:hypothetical protein
MYARVQYSVHGTGAREKRFKARFRTRAAMYTMCPFEVSGCVAEEASHPDLRSDEASCKRITHVKALWKPDKRALKYACRSTRVKARASNPFQSTHKVFLVKLDDQEIRTRAQPQDQMMTYRIDTSVNWIAPCFGLRRGVCLQRHGVRMHSKKSRESKVVCNLKASKTSGATRCGEKNQKLRLFFQTNNATNDAS